MLIQKTLNDAMVVHGRMQKFKPQGSSLNLRDIMFAKRQSQPKTNKETRRTLATKFYFIFLFEQTTHWKKELSNKRPSELLGFVQYFIIFIDDKNRMMWIKSFKSKDKALKVF
jgi:hypothetical protein